MFLKHSNLSTSIIYIKYKNFKWLKKWLFRKKNAKKVHIDHIYLAQFLTFQKISGDILLVNKCTFFEN